MTSEVRSFAPRDGKWLGTSYVCLCSNAYCLRLRSFHYSWTQDNFNPVAQLHSKVWNTYKLNVKSIKQLNIITLISCGRHFVSYVHTRSVESHCRHVSFFVVWNEMRESAVANTSRWLLSLAILGGLLDFFAGLLETARPTGPNSERDFKVWLCCRHWTSGICKNSCFCTEPGAKTPTHQVMHCTWNQESALVAPKLQSTGNVQIWAKGERVKWAVWVN